MSEELFAKLMKEAQEHMTFKKGTAAPTRKTKEQAAEEIKNLIQKSEEEATAVAIEETTQAKEEIMEKHELKNTWWFGHGLNASELIYVDGQIVKLWKKTDDDYIITFEDGKVPISKTSTMRMDAYHKGFKFLRIQLKNIEERIIAVRLTIEKLYAIGMKKYGEPLYPIFWDVDSSDMKGIVGTKKQIDEFLGIDQYKKDASKTFGYDTPTSVECTGSTKEEFNLLALDIVGPNGEAYNDGQGYLNMMFKFTRFISDKKKEDGVEASHLTVDAFQGRCFYPVVQKGQFACSAYMVHDICKSYSIPNWERYDGVVNFDGLKTNSVGLKHGDAFTVKAKDFKIVNMLSDEAGSSIGVQMVTHRPTVVNALMEELNISDRGHIFKNLIEGDLEAAYSILSHPSMKSMEDSDIAPAQFIAAAVPDGNGGYRMAYHKTNIQRWAARCVKYYTSDLLKIPTSESAMYAMACPIILNMEGQIPTKEDIENHNIIPALDYYENQYFEQIGKRINFVVYPNNKAFIREVASKKYLNSHRHPVVGVGSVQRDINLPVECVKELRSLGFKSITVKVVDGKKYAVSSVTEGYMISYGHAQAQNGDFDGDMQYFIVSDVADFGVVRMPKKEKEKEVEKLIVDESNYHKYLIYKYTTVINSQPSIGLMDLLVRRIIEENRLNCKPLTVSQYMYLAAIREAEIQGRKHLPAGIDLENPPSQKEHWKVVSSAIAKRFHWNKFVNPIPASAPATHRLKVFGASGTGVRVDDSITGINNILNLIPIAKKQKNYYDDPYAKTWDNFADAKHIEIIHQDSKYLEGKFIELWNRLAAGDKELLGVEVSTKRLNAVISFVQYLVFGSNDTKWDGYGKIATKLGEIEDEDFRRKEFFRLNKALDIKIARFIEEQAGFDPVKVDLMKKILTIRFGVTGFGAGVSKKGAAFSYGGRCLWRMKMKYCCWVFKQIHPDNKMIDVIIKDYKIKL